MEGREEEGARGHCFDWVGVRVLAGRGCVLFRNVGFFDRAAVAVLACEAVAL